MDFHGWRAHGAPQRARGGRGRARDRAGHAAPALLDDAAGSDPFWRHPASSGPALAPDENGWINFGGDKAWPAPQADWQRMVGKGWPPPRDVRRGRARGDGRRRATIELVSPVDPAYGLRVRRRISLHATTPVLSIETTYEKVAGAAGPRRRLDDHAAGVARSRCSRCCRSGRRSRAGIAACCRRRRRISRVDGRLLSLARDPTREDDDRHRRRRAAVGRRRAATCVIETIGTPSRRRARRPRRWPEGAHSQIYTSPDGAEPYVELELLGPLVDLAPGQRAMMSVRYRLLRAPRKRRRRSRRRGACSPTELGRAR